MLAKNIKLGIDPVVAETDVKAEPYLENVSLFYYISQELQYY